MTFNSISNEFPFQVSHATRDPLKTKPFKRGRFSFPERTGNLTTFNFNKEKTASLLTTLDFLT